MEYGQADLLEKLVGIGKVLQQWLGEDGDLVRQ